MDSKQEYLKEMEVERQKKVEFQKKNRLFWILMFSAVGLLVFDLAPLFLISSSLIFLPIGAGGVLFVACIGIIIWGFASGAMKCPCCGNTLLIVFPKYCDSCNEELK